MVLTRVKSQAMAMLIEAQEALLDAIETYDLKMAGQDAEAEARALKRLIAQQNAYSAAMLEFRRRLGERG